MLEASAHAGGRGRGMNGTHRGHGIFVACALPDGAPALPVRLADVAPWLARVMGLAWAADGAAAAGAPGRAAVAYAEDEEAMVAERLRALGYLE